MEPLGPRWRRTPPARSPRKGGEPKQDQSHRDLPSLNYSPSVFRGLRRSEAVGLPWAETDLTLGTVHISEQLVASSYDVWEDKPKMESGERTIKLDSETRTLLQLWCERQDMERAKRKAHAKSWKRTGLVFTWEVGGAYHPEYLSQVFMRPIKRLGLPPVRLHDLRHCAATLLLAAGLHMKAMQTLPGHSSYSLTADTYTSVLSQFEEAQAEALALVPRRSPVRRDALRNRRRRPTFPRKTARSARRRVPIRSHGRPKCPSE